MKKLYMYCLALFLGIAGVLYGAECSSSIIRDTELQLTRRYAQLAQMYRSGIGTWNANELIAKRDKRFSALRQQVPFSVDSYIVAEIGGSETEAADKHVFITEYIKRLEQYNAFSGFMKEA